MNTLQFSDHLVSYEMFIKDLASQIVRFLKEDSHDPEFISQRKAFELFGRRNIERWKKLGLVEGFCSIENGATFPSKNSITKICKALDIPESYLLLFSISEEDIPEDKRILYKTLCTSIKEDLIEKL